MDLYVIFCNPADYPGQFVVCRQNVGRDSKITKDPRPLAIGNLATCRDALPLGLTRLDRDPADDPGGGMTQNTLSKSNLRCQELFQGTHLSKIAELFFGNCRR